MTEDIEKMDFDRLVSNQVSPGEMLRQAREARKLSHIDVAKQLKLRVQWIVDIENDNYKDAAALIYVRGYLSSYARVVNLQPEEVLNAFNEMKFDEPFKTRKQPSVSEEQFINQQPVLSYSKSKKSTMGKMVRLVAILVVIVLVVLVVMWWRGQKTPQVAPANATSPQVNLPAQMQASKAIEPVAIAKPREMAAPRKASKRARWKRLPNH